jgi:hypothetical protein
LRLARDVDAESNRARDTVQAVVEQAEALIEKRPAALRIATAD